MAVIQAALGLLSCLGFGVWRFLRPFGMDFLDFFDFLTNSVMMPIAAVCTCVLILIVVKIQNIEKEITGNGSLKFYLRKIYEFVLKYLSVTFVVIILVSSVLNALGIIHM